MAISNTSMVEFTKALSESKRCVLDEVLQCWEDLIHANRPERTSWGEYRFMPGFLAETAKFVYHEWEDIKEDDVIVIAFPKTGTNWLTEIVRQIIYSRDQEAEKKSRQIPGPMMNLEAGPASKYQLWEYIDLPRRVFFSHLPRELFNNEKFISKKTKLIYIARNPKDQIVSLFHFVQQFPDTRGLMENNFNYKWNPFFDLCMTCKLHMESKEEEWYMEHLLGWYDTVMKDENKMFIFYEEIKKDTPAAVKKISKFLDVDLTIEEIKSISEKCEIGCMKQMVEKEHSEYSKFQKQLKVIRKGCVGEWKNYFTVAQSEYIDKEVSEKIGHLGINFIYELEE